MQEIIDYVVTIIVTFALIGVAFFAGYVFKEKDDCNQRGGKYEFDFGKCKV